jgi:hypothetical protein
LHGGTGRAVTSQNNARAAKPTLKKIKALKAQLKRPCRDLITGQLEGFLKWRSKSLQTLWRTQGKMQALVFDARRALHSQRPDSQLALLSNLVGYCSAWPEGKEICAPGL